jgi:hypothetical protein
MELVSPRPRLAHDTLEQTYSRRKFFAMRQIRGIWIIPRTIVALTKSAKETHIIAALITKLPPVRRVWAQIALITRLAPLHRDKYYENMILTVLAPSIDTPTISGCQALISTLTCSGCANR